MVHYVSRGSADGEYPSTCRAAIVTGLATGPGDPLPDVVHLTVFNPEGYHLATYVLHDDGAGNPGDPDCPSRHNHGAPLRYCGERGCGWQEPGHRGGTWHWQEGPDHD